MSPRVPTLAPAFLSALLATGAATANAAPKVKLPSATPSAGPAAAPARAPVVSPNVLLRSRPVAPSPALSRLMLASLRRFANGVENPTAVDREIAKVLGRNRNAKQIAKQLIARIDARPARERQRAFGKEPPAQSVGLDELSVAIDHAGMMFSGIGVMPPGSLPDEDVAPPTSYELKISGLEPVKLSDGDADGDELLAITAFVSLTPAGYATKIASAPGEGTLDAITTTSPIPLDVSVFNGNETGVLASVVVEVDGGADLMRGDFATMIALAQAHAQLLATPNDTDTTRITRFAMTLDYTVALLAVANPEKWPTGALQKTILTGSTALFALYATPASTAGAVPWKITHDHALPSGHYKLYYDVPSPVRSRSRLKVVVTKADALDPLTGGADLTLSIDIDGASAERNLPSDKATNTLAFAVQRKLAPDRAVAKVEVVLMDRYAPEWSLDPKCGQSQNLPPCWEFAHKEVDINPNALWSALGVANGNLTALFDVDLATGVITGTATGKLGETLTVQGDKQGSRGRVSLVITLEK